MLSLHKVERGIRQGARSMINRIWIPSSFVILFFSLLNWISLPVQACTRIFWNNNTQAKVFARTMDLYISDMPTLVVSPRGLNRSGQAGQNSIRWKAKYGSVVVTAFHSDAVTDGMNERGLAAHLLYLSETEYLKRDPKTPGLSNSLWVQYVLDNFSTVNQIINNLDHYQIVSEKVHEREWPLHLVIEDATGDSAIIEFLNGKRVIHHGSEYRVLTNTPAYSIQLENLKKYEPLGKLPLPGGTDSISRFVRASFFLNKLPQPKDSLQAIAGVYSAMRPQMVPFGSGVTNAGQAVGNAQLGTTYWISLGDLSNKIYYFQSTHSPNLIWLNLNRIPFEKLKNRQAIDPHNVALHGEIAQEFNHSVYL